MKRIFISTLLLTTLAVTNTNAQVKDNLSFGPIAGVGHTSISGNLGDDEIERRFNSSFNLGLRLVYSTHPNWGFGGDLSYRTEGVKIGATTSSEEIRLQSNYIRLEPKAYYFFGKPSQSFRPKISAGPSFGFFAGGNIKTYENGQLIDKAPLSDYIKSFDLGIAGAVGFNYRLATKTWLNFDLAYTHGLLNVAKENDDEAAQNRSLFLNVGLLFGIGSAKK